mmetsp:Transcript_5365/g.18003  ORF Transcript_5365/g.18003 Transcript_5365/m.18003 type:complete len:210 (+) Transcript_5365:372-1001(+)
MGAISHTARSSTSSDASAGAIATSVASSTSRLGPACHASTSSPEPPAAARSTQPKLCGGRGVASSSPPLSCRPRVANTKRLSRVCTRGCTFGWSSCAPSARMACEITRSDLVSISKRTRFVIGTPEKSPSRSSSHEPSRLDPTNARRRTAAGGQHETSSCTRLPSLSSSHALHECTGWNGWPIATASASRCPPAPSSWPLPSVRGTTWM